MKQKLIKNNRQLSGASLLIIAFFLPYFSSMNLAIGVIDVNALSGSAVDIQTAINQVDSLGGGNVLIPSGTFNFVEVGEPLVTVNIPTGVNVFGSTTERDSDGQVVEWKTILVMPWDVPSNTWFKVGDGSQDPNKSSRFSDIKLVGYRSIDPASTTMPIGIAIYGIVDFRIDHCMFEHICGGGVTIPAWYQDNYVCNGVIDHCSFVNYYGYSDLGNYLNGNVGYGVQIHRSYIAPDGDMPFDPIMDVIGKYNDYTVFIEDCYFSKWRHCVSSNHGAHYVFRYNTVNEDFGHFSTDVHGLRDIEEGHAGTRAAEIYENTFTNCANPLEGPQGFEGLFQNGGGGGVWFNNYADDTYTYIALYAEDYVVSDTWHLKDFYLWSAKGRTPIVNYNMGPIDSSRNVVEAWSRPAYTLTDSRYPNTDSSWTIAGYKPYTYPHPLVSGEAYIPPEPTPPTAPTPTELPSPTEPTEPSIIAPGSDTLIPIQFGLALAGAYLYVSGGKKKR